MRQRLSRVQEVEQALLDLIGENREPEGRLPAETEIAERFGVSRVTVRDALSSLARQGLIVRKQGLGTFVNRTITGIQARLDTLLEISELIRRSGHKPEITLIEFQRGLTQPSIAARLRVEPDAEALTIHKVFSADGSPAVYVMNVLPLDLIPNARVEAVMEELQPDLPVYEVLDRWFDEQVAYQIADLAPRIADENLARHLTCRSGEPILFLEEVGFNREDRPVLFSREFYRAGAIQFRLVRRPH